VIVIVVVVLVALLLLQLYLLLFVGQNRITMTMNECVIVREPAFTTRSLLSCCFARREDSKNLSSSAAKVYPELYVMQNIIRV